MPKRVLDIEEKLRKTVEGSVGRVEAKKDAEVLSQIAESLPSLSKVRIYKRDEEGNKSFVAAINAEDFDSNNPHEWIKNKYQEKFGGGEYLIELVNSDGKVVDRGEISIAEAEDEEKVESKDRYYRELSKAMEVREKAMEKAQEAEKVLREAEKTKYETAIDTLNKQWETISRLYEARIQDLQQAKEKAPEGMQILYQNMIESYKRDLDFERRRIEAEMAKYRESSTAVDKMFDLVNQLMPMILQRGDDRKDPVVELQRTLELVQTVTGGKKDVIESMIENPEKMKVFQKLLGIEEKKEERKGFFDDIFENPEKLEMFRRMMGLDRKDFITELFENPQRFEMLKKIMGIDTIEEIAREATRPKEIQEKPKSLLDEVIETTSKIDQLKRILGPQQPVKSFVELLGTLAQSLGPYVVKAVEKVTDNMVTIEAIRHGLVKKSDIRHVIPEAGFAGVPERPTEIQTERTIQQTKTEEATSEADNIEQMFESTITEIAMSNLEGVSPDIFVSTVTDKVVDAVKKKPSLVFSLLKMGDRDAIVRKMSSIINKVLVLEEAPSIQLASAIADSVVAALKA